MREATVDTTMTRRAVVQAVATMLGGTALTGGDRLLAFSFDNGALEQALAEGAGMVCGS